MMELVNLWVAGLTPLESRNIVVCVEKWDSSTYCMLTLSHLNESASKAVYLHALNFLPC